MGEKTIVYIDGDFATDTPCPHHCSPTCHPAQTGPGWRYGCTHPAWPQNRPKYGGFCPIVECGGELEKCEIPDKLIGRYTGGLKRSITCLEKKLASKEAALANVPGKRG